MNRLWTTAAVGMVCSAARALVFTPAVGTPGLDRPSAANENAVPSAAAPDRRIRANRKRVVASLTRSRRNKNAIDRVGTTKPLGARGLPARPACPRR